MDRHERFREWIADRLTGDLQPAADERLRRHLGECPRCRMVDRSYQRERDLLRTLRERPAPRDLWARTTAALDREMSRRPRGRPDLRPDPTIGRPAGDRPTQRRAAPVLMITALASFIAAVTVVGTRLSVVELPVEEETEARIVAPTPFDVPTQALAFVQVTAAGLAIYEATVDRACPAAAPDCAIITAARQSVGLVPGELSAGDIDLHSPNGRLALLTADDNGNETVSVVFLPPADDLVPGPAPGDPRPPGTSPSIGATGAPTATPPAATDIPPRPTQPVAGGASTTPSADPSTASASAPIQGTATAPGSAPASAAPVPAPVQAVLEDVHVVGAPPAWSADGEQLAFSAMPADRSEGPDIYLWRLGDARAKRLTADHRSYFASWARERIVVSRPGKPSEGGAYLPSTHLIDPQTSEERQAPVEGAWLPSVDPTGQFAIVWVGQMGVEGRALQPGTGALYLVDWRLIDPFRADIPSDVEDPPQTPASVEPSAARPEKTLSSERPGRGRGDRPRRSEPSFEAKPSPMAPTPTVAPTQAPTAPTDAAQPVPLEPQRDIAAHPVREWRISWSDDGSAFGFWVTERPGDTWGRLAVYRMDSAGERPELGAVLLPATLARRAFTLGSERVAWIGPSAERPDGELRLQTWGTRGSGGMRIREIDVLSGMPAF